MKETLLSLGIVGIFGICLWLVSSKMLMAIIFILTIGVAILN